MLEDLREEMENLGFEAGIYLLIFRHSPGEQIDLLQNGEQNYVKEEKAWLPKLCSWVMEQEYSFSYQYAVKSSLETARKGDRKSQEKKKKRISIGISKLSVRNSIGLESMMH